MSTLMGARGAGLGYATVALTDDWALFNNIGGLSSVQSKTALFSFEVNPFLPGANRASAGIVLPTKPGTIGLGVFRFGDKLYSEQVLSAGFSNRYGIASLGLKLNYIQYRAEGFGTHSTVGINFGGIAELSSKISVGAYIVNLNQPKLSTNNERLPVKLTTGVRFNPTEKVTIATEIEKDIDNTPIIKGGIEFNVYKKIQFRSGFNINPSSFHSGIGYKDNHLVIDYSVQFNTDLRAGHQISAAYRIHSKK